MDATRVLPSILRLRWSRCCCMTNKSASVIDADTQSSSSPTADRVAERKSKRLVRSSLVDIDRLCCTRWCHAHPDSRAGHTYSARCCAVHCTAARCRALLFPPTAAVNVFQRRHSRRCCAALVKRFLCFTSAAQQRAAYVWTVPYAAITTDTVPRHASVWRKRAIHCTIEHDQDSSSSRTWSNLHIACEITYNK